MSDVEKVCVACVYFKISQPGDEPPRDGKGGWCYRYAPRPLDRIHVWYDDGILHLVGL